MQPRELQDTENQAMSSKVTKRLICNKLEPLGLTHRPVLEARLSIGIEAKRCKKEKVFLLVTTGGLPLITPTGH